jgi:hypothetical protein
MISDNIPQPVDDDLVRPYFLWKLLIDAPLMQAAWCAGGGICSLAGGPLRRDCALEAAASVSP